MIFETLVLSPSFSLSVSAVMSDTTAGAQRTVESAFILPLIGQITQTMDLASRDPNSIPTVDSGHSPACIRRAWERRFPSIKTGGKEREERENIYNLNTVKQNER